jgi:hypothetical protein
VYVWSARQMHACSSYAHVLYATHHYHHHQQHQSVRAPHNAPAHTHTHTSSSSPYEGQNAVQYYKSYHEQVCVCVCSMQCGVVYIYKSILALIHIHAHTHTHIHIHIHTRTFSVQHPISQTHDLGARRKGT